MINILDILIQVSYLSGLITTFPVHVDILENLKIFQREKIETIRMDNDIKKNNLIVDLLVNCKNISSSPSIEASIISILFLILGGILFLSLIN